MRDLFYLLYVHQRSGDFDSATTGYCKSRTAFRVPKKGDEGKHSSPCLTLGKSFIEKPIFLSLYIRSPKTLFSNHALPLRGAFHSSLESFNKGHFFLLIAQAASTAFPYFFPSAELA